jgi:FkbM family methyltransferase
MSTGQSASLELDRMKLSVGGVQRDFYFRRNSSDGRVIGQIFHDNCYDLRRLRRFDQIIEFVTRRSMRANGPLIVDAGANIGASSVYFASKFPDSLVTAIEPDFGNYQLLAENTRGLRVNPVHGALAATAGRSRVVDAGEGFWGYRTQPVHEAEQGGIRRITMNQVYEMLAPEWVPFIVKIDIEGGEKDLFSKDVEWVRRTPLIIIELHDWLLTSEANSSSFLRCVSQLDRDFVYIGEDVYSIANDLEHDVAWTDQGETMKNAVSTVRASARPTKEGAAAGITALEEPLEARLAAARSDFQTEIRVLRHTDEELRAGLDTLAAEKTQLQEALTKERSAAQEAQQALVSTTAVWVKAQDELREAWHELATNREELSGAREKLTALQQELSRTQEDLASSRQDLSSMQEKEVAVQQELSDTRGTLARTRQEMSGTQDKLARARQEVSATQEKFTALQQEMTNLQTREKSLVSELSLAISALQDLRDQLRGRDRTLAKMKQQSDRVQTQWATEQSKFVAKGMRLQEKLDSRNQELAGLRNQRLVRIAIKVGSRLNGWKGRSRP